MFNQSRSHIIRLIFLVAFVIIMAQLFYLQIIEGKYKKLAMDNAVFAKIIYPERGIIYDRKDKAILNNTIIYDLLVTPAEVKNIDTSEFCRLMQIDTTEFKIDFKRTKTSFFEKCIIKESGFSSEFGFKLMGKKWYLVYALDKNL